MNQPTSGRHGLAAEELLAQSRQPDIEEGQRFLFIGAAIVQALLSVSGQLGEIIEWAGVEDPENPATGHPWDRTVAEVMKRPDVGPLISCGFQHPEHSDLVCQRQPDHLAEWPKVDIPHGCTPSGLGHNVMITWRDADHPDPDKLKWCAYCGHSELDHAARRQPGDPYCVAGGECDCPRWHDPDKQTMVPSETPIGDIAAAAHPAATALVDCSCPERNGQIYHQRGTCTDPTVARLDWYASSVPTFTPAAPVGHGGTV